MSATQKKNVCNSQEQEKEKGITEVQDQREKGKLEWYTLAEITTTDENPGHGHWSQGQRSVLRPKQGQKKWLMAQGKPEN